MNIQLTKEQVKTLDVFLDRIKEARCLIYSRYFETYTIEKEVDRLIYKTLRDLTDINDVDSVIVDIEQQIELQNEQQHV